MLLERATVARIALAIRIGGIRVPSEMRQLRIRRTWISSSRLPAAVVLPSKRHCRSECACPLTGLEALHHRKQLWTLRTIGRGILSFK